MRSLISAYPDVSVAEFESRLDEELRARGSRVADRLDHPHGQVFPALSAVLARHPGARAFTFFEPVPVGVAAPTTVVHEHGATGAHWDAPLVRALSQAFGGWGLSMLADRQREEYGLGVFYAGCTAEAVAWQGGQAALRWAVPAEAQRLDEDGTWRGFAAHYSSISDAPESDLRWSDEVNVRSWVVQGPAQPTHTMRLDAAALAGCSLRRAVFINLGAAQLQAALSQAGTAAKSLRTLERAAPVTQTPYVLLDGEFDDAWFTALARTLNVQASAVDLRGSEGQFTWCEVRTNRNLAAGVDRGAAALANLWGALTVMLGEPASIVRWPRPLPAL